MDTNIGHVAVDAIATDDDGSQIGAVAVPEYQVVEFHVQTPTDTYIRVDLSADDAERFALEVLALVKGMR